MSAKDLTRMMLSGKKEDVMRYLRSLPPDESTRLRKKLLFNIDQMQRKATEIRGTKKARSPSPPSNEPKKTVKELNSSSDSVRFARDLKSYLDC